MKLIFSQNAYSCFLNWPFFLSLKGMGWSCCSKKAAPHHKHLSLLEKKAISNLGRAKTGVEDQAFFKLWNALSASTSHPNGFFCTWKVVVGLVHCFVLQIVSTLILSQFPRRPRNPLSSVTFLGWLRPIFHSCCFRGISGHSLLRNRPVRFQERRSLFSAKVLFKELDLPYLSGLVS